MAEQYSQNDSASFQKLEPINSFERVNDPAQALYADAYSKCMGGGPGAKCGAPTAAVESTSPALSKQPERVDWFTRSDNNKDGQLSRREVDFALSRPETRNLAVVRLLDYKFDELAGLDGLVSMADLERYVKGSEKRTLKK